MIDAVLLPRLGRLYAGPARWLAAREVTADQVSLAGFGFGVLAVVALWGGIFTLALMLIAANRIADGMDGALARLRGPTDRGAFLDIALDFAFYALVPLGFALHDPANNALPAAILIASFVGTGSSFLAFAVIAARRNLTAPLFPNKGLYYLGGLTEGAETIAVFAAMCLWPAAFPVLAVLFAALCAVTTGLRWRMGWQTFS